MMQTFYYFEKIVERYKDLKNVMLQYYGIHVGCIHTISILVFQGGMVFFLIGNDWGMIFTFCMSDPTVYKKKVLSA